MWNYTIEFAYLIQDKRPRCNSITLRLLLSMLCLCCLLLVDATSLQASELPPFKARDGRTHPVVAVIADNRFTELSDYVIPYSILKQANLGEVYALGMQEGSIQMLPALRIRAQFSAVQFDQMHPTGADYVIVPAVHHSDDPNLITWIQTQAKKGATIVGICDGVWVLAHAGLLESKKAVGHWYSFDDLTKQFPSTQFIKDKRYLADEKIVTSTGVSASIPVSLALVEAMVGKPKAQAVANSLGIANWDAQHRSADFKLSATHMWTASINWLRFWSHDQFVIPTFNGIDELSLALLVDAYSRTYRSTVFSMSKEAITSLRGLQVEPDQMHAAQNVSILSMPADLAAGESLDWALNQIANRYDERTANFVALQMEYPYRSSAAITLSDRSKSVHSTNSNK